MLPASLAWHVDVDMLIGSSAPCSCTGIWYPEPPAPMTPALPFLRLTAEEPRSTVQQQVLASRPHSSSCSIHHYYYYTIVYYTTLCDAVLYDLLRYTIIRYTIACSFPDRPWVRASGRGLPATVLSISSPSSANSEFQKGEGTRDSTGIPFFIAVIAGSALHCSDASASFFASKARTYWRA